MFQLAALHTFIQKYFFPFSFAISLLTIGKSEAQVVLPESQLELIKNLGVRTLKVRSRTFKGRTYDPNADFTIQYAFDQQGRMKEIFQSYVNRVESLSRVYQYFQCEDHGLIRFYKDSKLEEIKIVTFDRFCRVASENYYDVQGRLTRKVLRDYKRTGKLHSMSYIYSDQKLSNRIEYYYDSDLETSQAIRGNKLVEQYTKRTNNLGLTIWERDDLYNEIREYVYDGPYCIRTQYTNSSQDVLYEEYFRYLFFNNGLLRLRESQSISTLPGPDIFTVEQFFYTFY